MKTVKLSKKNQIAIPKKIRKMLDISPGDTLIIDNDGEKILILPVPKKYSEHMKKLHKEIWEKVDIKEYLKNERQSWDKQG